MDLNQIVKLIFAKEQKQTIKQVKKKPNWKTMVFSTSNAGIMVYLYVNKHKQNKKTNPKNKDKHRQRLHPLTKKLMQNIDLNIKYNTLKLNRRKHGKKPEQKISPKKIFSKQ